MPSADQIWQAALGELELQITRPNFNTWLKGTRGLSWASSDFTVGVSSAFVAEYLETNQLSLIERTLSRLTGEHTRASFKVMSSNRNENCSNTSPDTCINHRFNPRYTFESFITGPSNELACAAAMGAARGPGKLYNPLFIYGGVGLGKTHLMHAIGHVAEKNNLQAIYVSGEQFTNEFVCALKSNNIEEFRSRYRSVDILMVDDIQFISGKGQTEECFFHTFNELHNGSRQIVVSSDRPPRDMSLIEDRLRSRFEWGLTVDIKPPNLETRKAILKHKARREKAEVSEEVIDLLASKDRNNIRELEGSLNRIFAYSRLLDAEVTPELAERAITDIGSHPVGNGSMSADSVIRCVAQAFSLEISELSGPRRDKTTALARQVAMYLLKINQNYPLEKIGGLLGGRRPATVSHACEKLSRELDSNPPLKRQVEAIQDRLTGPELS